MTEADVLRAAKKALLTKPTVVAYGDVAYVPHYDDVVLALQHAGPAAEEKAKSRTLEAPEPKAESTTVKASEEKAESKTFEAAEPKAERKTSEAKTRIRAESKKTGNK